MPGPQGHDPEDAGRVDGVLAGTAGLDVEIGRPGEDAVDATSILGVMALGAKHGEEVVLTADGDGADEALDGLVALLSRDLDAE